ncbi:MAG: hypothetical protein ACRDRX_22515 [Pseudonocardiaceae bacterium]
MPFVEIFRALSMESPAAFIDHLRTAMRIHADLLDQLGRTGEAEEIRRRLATGNLGV